MGVDAAAGIAFRKCSNEERCALGGLVDGWGAEIDTGFWVRLCGEGEDVDVFGFHEFFLDAGGGEVDQVTGKGLVSGQGLGLGERNTLVADAGSSTSSSDPAQAPEYLAETWDEVCGVLRVA